MKTESEQYFTTVTSVLLTIFGSVLNTLVVILYLNKKLRDQSMSRYIVGLAISDQIELMSSVALNNANNFKFDSFNCKVSTFIASAFFEYCSFIITIISIDRWVTVRFPRRLIIKNSFKFQLAVLTFAFILTIPLAAAATAYYEKVDIDNETLFCDFSDKEIGSYISSFGFIVAIIIPVVIMTTCSILVWKQLKISKNKVSGLNKDIRKEDQLFRIMIFMHIYFLFCHTPINVYTITITIFHELNNPFVFIALNTVSLFHNTFSFFVHLASNKIFRVQFLDIILMKKSNSVDVIKTTNQAVNDSVKLKTTHAFE